MACEDISNHVRSRDEGNGNDSTLNQFTGVVVSNVAMLVRLVVNGILIGGNVAFVVAKQINWRDCSCLAKEDTNLAQPHCFTAIFG